MTRTVHDDELLKMLRDPSIEFVGYEFDFDDPEESLPSYLLSCQTPAMSKYLRDICGLYHDPETKLTHFVPQLLDGAEAIANVISTEYDCRVWNKNAPDETPFWKHFGLGGDDDVDYNGSYINICVMVIRKWLELNPS